MATLGPAMISYTLEGDEVAQTISFHEVISEAHVSSSEITKYPVQNGFQVSNHVIRKNRVVTIEGIITNTQLAGSSTFRNYSETNNSATVFEALEALVNTGTTCEVVTNLGIYTPVLFNKFTTKQAAGTMDSMRFIISGEELILANSVNGTAPRTLSFAALSPAASVARIIELEKVGIEVCDCSIISEANLVNGESFVLDGVDEFGLPTKTTYVSNGQIL